MCQSTSKKLRLIGYVAGLALLASSYVVYATPKVPVVQKKQGQKNEQTFVGKIKSVDAKNRVLVLTTTEGDQEETFSYKKGVRITSAHKGGELKVADLGAGMLVTLYIKSTKSSSEVFEILVM